MDVHTIEQVLPIAKAHMTDAKYNAFVKQLRIAYVKGEIAMREQYLALKVQNTAIRSQYQGELITLNQQLAAL